MLKEISQTAITWAGALVSESNVHTIAAASPAGARWQAGLLRALSSNTVDVGCLSHQPQRIWPIGPCWTRPEQREVAGCHVSSLGYTNLPLLRQASLVRNYSIAATKWAMTRSVLITYNLIPQHRAIGQIFAKRGQRWFVVCADMDPIHEELLLQDCESYCEGAVFLSWGAYCRFNIKKKLFLDGGVDAPRRPVDRLDIPNREIIAYTGTLEPGCGVEFAIEAFNLLRNKSAELWISGHGTNPTAVQAAKLNARIKLHGLLPEPELQALCLKATLFVNPRPPSLVRNRNNFPSKILEYLCWGGPVVSTWTEGLHPDYRNVLVVVDTGSASAFASAIDSVLEWPAERLRAYRAQNLEWLNRERLWSAQATKLIEWINER